MKISHDSLVTEWWNFLSMIIWPWKLLFDFILTSNIDRKDFRKMTLYDLDFEIWQLSIREIFIKKLSSPKVTQGPS